MVGRESDHRVRVGRLRYRIDQRLARNPRIELAAIAHPTALSLDVAAFSSSVYIFQKLAHTILATQQAPSDSDSI
jgi:hypothetical protein